MKRHVLPPTRGSDATYTYDVNGNISTRSAPDTTTYSYDALDRLTREAGPILTQDLGYDGAGNRTSDGIGSYVYAPNSNRLTSRPQGPVSLDAAGHTLDDGTYAYTWDGPGRLKEVRLSGQLLATYHYDHRHRRTRKDTTAQAPQGAATVLYTYDPDDHLLAETDASGPIRSYVWRDDVPVAQIEHRPSRHVLYFETDPLNTPRAARDEAGTLVWRWEGDAFGSTPPDEDPDGDGTPTTVNLRYPGQYFDPESGLHYSQARYYDPTTGRYLSPDPIGLAGGVNTYLYAEANPLTYTDSTGEIAFIPIVVGIGAGYAFDYLLEQYKKEHCACKDTPAGGVGNAAAGGVIGGSGRFASKPRGGIAGGGESGTGTSAFSQMNHAAASRGWYSVATRNRNTRVLRTVPYAGAGLATYEVYDAFSCE